MSLTPSLHVDSGVKYRPTTRMYGGCRLKAPASFNQFDPDGDPFFLKSNGNFSWPLASRFANARWASIEEM